MYEQHFGLTARPFGSKAEGAGVFVGPRQAKLISALQKGLAVQGAVMTVTGPVGSGKTTIVARALDALPGGRKAAWVGRMQLDQDEVLELLLAGFGIGANTRGTIRKFAAFRRMLQDQASADIPVLIIVEDAQRIGIDGLVELEALTASDSGDGAGANIILMGQSGLQELLAHPDLARLKQRVRLRQKLEPYSLPEVQGYLKHCLREAGGNYDLMFDAGVAEIIAAASEGIPRVINSLCESALGAALEDHSARITTSLMNEVAMDTLGFDGSRVNPSSPPEATAIADIDVTNPGDDQIINGATSSATSSANEALNGIDRHDVDVESGCYPIPTDLSANDATNKRETADFDSQQPGEELENVAPASNVSAAVSAIATAPTDETVKDIAVARPADSGQAFEPTPENTQFTQDEYAAAESTNAESAPESSTEAEPGHNATCIGTQATQDGDVVFQREEPSSELINDTQPELRKLPGANEIENDGDNENVGFDLDAALSVETDATNVMPGVTPNLDALVAEAAIGETVVQQVVTEPLPAPASAASEEEIKDKITSDALEQSAADESLQSDVEPTLPTLSDSMRIDIDRELESARADDADIPGDQEDVEPAVPAIGRNDTEIDADSPQTETDAYAPSTDVESTDAPSIDPEPRATPDAVESGSDSLLDTPAPSPVALEPQPESNHDPVAAQSVRDERPDVAEDHLAVEDDLLANLLDADAAAIGDLDDAVDEQSVSQESMAAAELDVPATPVSALAELAEAEASAAQTQAIMAPAADASSQTPKTADPTDVEVFDDLEAVPDFDAAALEFEVPPHEPELEPLPEPEPVAVQGPENGTISMPELAISSALDRSKNDIDALEAALEAAKQGKISAPPPIDISVPETPANGDASKQEAGSDLPEITLDAVVTDAPPKLIDLDEHAKEISSANSLEEFSDAMAETLFGNEAFDQIAAAVVANPPAEGELELARTHSPVQLQKEATPDAANDNPENGPQDVTPIAASVDAKADDKPAVVNSAANHADSETQSTAEDSPVDLDASAAMRIDILNQMKNNVAGMAAENVEIGDPDAAPASLAQGPQPEPIERQINTSMTQTLEALNVAKMADAAASEKTEKKKGGLFSRFRRSS